MKAIVLFSGGLDSTVLLAGLVQEKVECLALAFDYGQRHVNELEAAEEIARHYSVPIEVIDLVEFAPTKTDDVVFAGRNLLFASIGVSIAHARGFDRVAIGCNASDWVRFPDCRPTFWNHVRNCALEAYGVTVTTPLLHYTKIDVVKIAREMGVPIEKTWSCYEPLVGVSGKQYEPCGKCLACTTRQQALAYEAA